MDDVSGHGPDRLRPAVLLAVAVAVALVTSWARARVGAGIYYDDGVYLGLARALAEGHGYAYANLPGSVPGVKYPPLYPAFLAVGWKAAGGYPAVLGPLKTLNALLTGAAAALFLAPFAGPGRRRTLAMAAVAGFGFLAAPTLTISTVLLSEPLFLCLAGAALLLAGRASRERAGLGVAAAAGLAAGAAFLTRSIGITVVVAVVAGIAWKRRSGREAGISAAAAGIPVAAWLGWSLSHAAAVPDALTGQYGGYLSWLAAGGGDGGRLVRTASANAGVLLESLRLVWIPEAPDWAAVTVALLLGAAAVAGLRRAATRNPALALFPIAYLLAVLAWPYEPYRFYYTILPVLTLFAVDGLGAAAGRLRAELPSWGIPAGVVASGLLALNAVQYQARAYGRRAWTITQVIPAAAYAPLTKWLRANSSPDDVIASGLDPYVYWETGRRSVPSWEFAASDYRPNPGGADQATLAGQVEAILSAYGPTYAAVILGDNRPALAIEAYAARHPDRVEKVFESTEAPYPGVIYRFERPSPSPVSPPNPR